MPQRTGFVRVQRGIEQNRDTQLLIIVQQRPKHRECDCHKGDTAQEPQIADTAGEGHNQKDKYENQRHAHIPGEDHRHTEQQRQMGAHMGNGPKGGDILLMGGHSRCHNQDKGDLTDLRNLNIKGQKRQVDPASVTADGFAKGDQQRQEQAVENHQRGGVLHKKLCVNRGDDGV